MRPALTLLLLFALVVFACAQQQENFSDPNKIIEQQRAATLMRQASKFYEAEDYKNALGRIEALPPEARNSPDTLNLLGAIHTKLKNYDEARQIFSSLMKQYPKFFPAAFNVGELQYLEGNYEEAQKTFTQYLEWNPTHELVRFRVIACNLKLDRDENAKTVAKGLNPAGSTPAWYYAQALFARKAGNKSDERKHLEAARVIYDEKDYKVFDEALAQEN